MIVVGYTADVFGRAALEHGVAEARRREAARARRPMSCMYSLISIVVIVQGKEPL